MRSPRDMPRIVIISEVLGMLLLVVAYLSINGYFSLPGSMGTSAAAIIMIFIGIGLMMPAAACIVWRVACGFGPLISRPQSTKESDAAHAKKDNKPDQDNN
jgi:Protein of unknown function (DUF1418)